jgi:hypothetical protein
MRDKAFLKEQLLQSSKKELVDMVLKLSAKRFNYEYLLVNFLDPQGGEQTLYEEALEDIELLCAKEYKGRTAQHRQVKMLGACVKRINDFTVEAKNKKLEADLILHVLERQFALPQRMFGAKYSGYDYKVGLLLKRLITILTKKIHSDYLADYQEAVNRMLTKLHHTSNRINTIKSLPEGI